MNNTITAAAPSYGTDGSFSADLSGLTPGQTYYFRAYAVVCGTGDYAIDEKTVEASSSVSFTMPVPEVESAVKGCGWLELPGEVASGNYVVNTYYAGSARNYTHLYDKDKYASLWTAYPLYGSTTGGSRKESWSANPSLNIPSSSQINTWNGSYGVSYGSTIYARGHQIPDADRSKNATMQEQTYYATNLVPQIQDHFNGGIWMNLEDALRNEIPASDTLYVVTGVTFKTAGGNESITYIQPQHDSKQCPVPNYFWKVVMKVKRNSQKQVTSASTVGFWFDHKQYKDSNETYATYAKSVDDIERLTGFDFFVNLPDSVESDAENNSSWSTFSSF